MLAVCQISSVGVNERGQMLDSKKSITTDDTRAVITATIQAIVATIDTTQTVSHEEPVALQPPPTSRTNAHGFFCSVVMILGDQGGAGVSQEVRATLTHTPRNDFVRVCRLPGEPETAPRRSSPQSAAATACSFSADANPPGRPAPRRKRLERCSKRLFSVVLKGTTHSVRGRRTASKHRFLSPRTPFLGH